MPRPPSEQTRRGPSPRWASLRALGVGLAHGEAVWFAVPGRQPDLELPYATPVAELIEAVRLGGTITVCTQCAARRELLVQDLVESATIQGAASFVEAALADNVQALVY